MDEQYKIRIYDGDECIEEFDIRNALYLFKHILAESSISDELLNINYDDLITVLNRDKCINDIIDE